MNNQAGKGDRHRSVNKELYDRNYERIFGGGKINYRTGDMFDCLDNKVAIVHVVNNRGRWGKGFTASLDNLDQRIGKEYRQYLSDLIRIGEEPLTRIVQYVTTFGYRVLGMVAQEGLRSKENPIPLRYPCLETCMKKVADLCEKSDLEIYCPKFGAGLAGGNWKRIEDMIKTYWSDIPVTVWEI